MRRAATIALVLLVATRAWAEAPAADEAPPVAPTPGPDPGAEAPPVPATEPASAAPRGERTIPPPSTFAPPGMTEPTRVPAATSSERVTPPLSAPRLVGEAAAGAAIGLAGLVVGAYAGAALECSGGCSGELGGFGGALIGAYLGGSLGVSVGVYAVGVAGDNDGSYATTVGGALLGPLVGGLAAALIEKTKGTSNNEAADTLAAMAFVGGWVGTAMVGFNATRSAPGPAVGAVLAFDHGHASVGIPLAVHTHDASYLTLAAGRF